MNPYQSPSHIEPAPSQLTQRLVHAFWVVCNCAWHYTSIFCVLIAAASVCCAVSGNSLTDYLSIETIFLLSLTMVPGAIVTFVLFVVVVKEIVTDWLGRRCPNESDPNSF